VAAARAFTVARNPEPDSKLPFLIRVPLPSGDLVLNAARTWPRTGPVYCHPGGEWPEDADILEQVAVTSCVRRGAAIDLVLRRGKENRSQIVFTRLKGGREAIFWQTKKTVAAARPGVRVPGLRASGIKALEIVVDTREQYAYRFPQQQAATVRKTLAAGDYGVEIDGDLVAAVERKSLANLARSLVDGSLPFTMAELATLARAAVVVEDRYSAVFKLEHVRPGFVAELLAATQVRYPNVPIVFCETRKLAEDWTFRFLGAALTFATREVETDSRL